MIFALAFGAVAFNVQPVKADTLDERVGALAVDTALSSFVDVLPSPEQVDSLGGVQSWLGKVGQQFNEAWERDNRNWQNFVDSIDGLVDDSFGSVFEVAENVVKDVRDVVYNFYNLIFGIEEEIGGYDTSGLSQLNIDRIADFNRNFSENPNKNYAMAICPNYPNWVALVNGSSVPINATLAFYATDLYRFKFDATLYNQMFYFSDVIVIFYWGSINVDKTNVDVPNAILVNMGSPSETVQFVPTVNNNYFNKYYFGFGNGSSVSPNRIVNNYDTVYNYVTNNYYTDAVREIKDSPKGYYSSPVDTNGNGVSINGIGDITIDLPNADGFGDLFGDSDTSEVFAVENSSWLSLINMLPQSILVMLFIAIAVGCVCCVIKAVR